MLEKVINEEQSLQFTRFTHDDALTIVLHIVAEVKAKYPKPVGIRIVHNDLLILHYLMDGRKESPWLNRKERTVLESGHSSLYTALKMGEKPLYKAWMQDERYAICGGGFPIIEDGIVTGAICVSGLDHLDDHALIIHALEDLLGK